MQYKTLAALLFASAAFAAPAPESTATADLDSTYDDLQDEYESRLAQIPSSVMSILATMEPPTTWAESLMSNTAFADAEASRVADGDFPAWVTSLPEAVRTYAENELQAQASVYINYSDITGSGAAATSDASSTASGDSSSATESSSQTAETSAGTATSSATPSATPSGSDSDSASSSTSTGGAPAPTGMAMSLAGAAGVLGLALAL